MRRSLLCLLPLIALLVVAADKADEPDRKKVKAGEPAEKAKKGDTDTKPAEKTKKDDPPAKPKKDAAEPRSAERKPSSLKVGGDLPGSFHPYNATGSRKGKYHCLISQHGYNSMVLVFVRTLDLGDAFKDFLHKLDAAIDKNPGAHLAALVVHVPDDLNNVVEEDDQRDQLAGKLEDLARDQPALKHVVLALDTKADVAKYLVDDDAVMTVILHRKYRIEAIHVLPKDQVTEDKVAQILAEVVTKLGAVKK